MSQYYYNRCDGEVYTEKQMLKSSAPRYEFRSLGKFRSKEEAEEKADMLGL